MKIAPAKQEAFLKNPGSCRAFLLFGPDEGQSRLLSQQLIRHFLGAKYDPMDLTEISADSLSESPSLLSDELGSFSLLGGDRLVLLRHPATEHAKTIESALLSGPEPLWPLIILAGDLRPTSALRKLFEKQDSLAALACYHDDARKITQLLSESLKQRGISCEQGVIQLLANSLGNDRAITMQEIEKIDLYLGEERHLTTTLVQLLCGDNRDHRLDELFDAVCSGHGNLEDTLTRCYLEGVQPIGIYRMLSSHLQKLLSIKRMMAQGMAQKAAFTRHGVFFKQEAATARQLRCWSEAALKRALHALLEAEHQAKFAALPPEMQCKQLLHTLSRHATATGGRQAA